MSNSRHSKYFLLQRLPKSVWLYLFRHKRLMELDELSGRTTGRLGDTWPTTACAIGGTAAGTTILYHLRICRRLHSSSVMTAGRRELLEDGPLPPGPQDLPRDYWPDGAAGGLSWSTLRQADDATTRPSGAGRHVSPTAGTRSQTTCYVRRGTGRV